MLAWRIRTLNSRPKRRQQLDRDVRLLPAQHGERRLAQAEAGEVFVDRDGRRTRPAIEQRQFTEHRAGREGDEPDIAVVVPEMHAGAAPGDEVERRAGIAAPEDDMPGRPRHRLQPAAQPLDLVGGEIAEQRKAVERQFERLPGSGVAEQIVLRPFDGAIDIGEKPVAVKDIGKPRGRLGAAGQDQRELDAARAKRGVDIAEDAGARRIDLGHAPQFQQQGRCPLHGFAVDDLGQPLGACRRTARPAAR